MVLLEQIDGAHIYINPNWVESIEEVPECDYVIINVNEGSYRVKGYFYTVAAKFI